MLVTDRTTSLDVKAELLRLNAHAMRLPRASDLWVTLHCEIYRLQGLLDGLLKREADDEATRGD